MTYREVARKLRQLGSECRRQSKGSHEIRTNTRTNLSAVVPRYSADIPIGTLSATLTIVRLAFHALPFPSGPGSQRNDPSAASS
jgi:predicted RNA binding protein YcfA (HicA-like mRNA interferase family)